MSVEQGKQSALYSSSGAQHYGPQVVGGLPTTQTIQSNYLPVNENGVDVEESKLEAILKQLATFEAEIGLEPNTKTPAMERFVELQAHHLLGIQKGVLGKQ